MRRIGLVTCEVRTIDTAPGARSTLLLPEHAVLAALAGGGRDVAVRVDGSPAFRGPKLAGAAGFFPAGRRMESVWPAGRLRYLLVTAPQAEVERLADHALPDDAWRTQADLADTLAQAILQELGRLVVRPASPVDDLLASALVDTLLLRLIQRSSTYGDPAPGPAGPLGPTLDHIEAHLDRALTVADLSAISGIPRARLHRAFRESTGLAPHQYVTQRRLARAAELLAGTDLPVGEVAARVGCASGSHLAALLRVHRDASPRAIRHRAKRS